MGACTGSSKQPDDCHADTNMASLPHCERQSRPTTPTTSSCSRSCLMHSNRKIDNISKFQPYSNSGSSMAMGRSNDDGNDGGNDDSNGELFLCADDPPHGPLRRFVGALTRQGLKCMLHLFKHLVAVANCMHGPAAPSTKLPLIAAKLDTQRDGNEGPPSAQICRPCKEKEKLEKALSTCSRV